jgi:FkbM family methyltransferase
LASEGESRVKRLLLALGRWYVRHIPAHRGRSRLLRACFHLFPGERFTCRLKAGFLMSLPAADPVARQMMLCGEWEAENTALLQRLLRPGDTFVDVGANLGYFTLLGASLVSPGGQVVALEPVPPTYQLLLDNIALNPGSEITALQVAASSREGTLTLSLFPGDSAATASQFMAWRESAQVQVVVPATTLDLCLQEMNHNSPALIKIDAEGGEYAILQGAGEVLAGWQPILMLEVLPALAEAAGWQPANLLDLLAQHGYSCFVDEGGHLRPLAPDRDFPDVVSQSHIELFAFNLSVPWHTERLQELTG